MTENKNLELDTSNDLIFAGAYTAIAVEVLEGSATMWALVSARLDLHKDGDPERARLIAVKALIEELRTQIPASSFYLSEVAERMIVLYDQAAAVADTGKVLQAEDRFGGRRSDVNYE